MSVLKEFAKHLIFFTLIDHFKKNKETGTEEKLKRSNKYALGCGCLTLTAGIAATAIAGAYLLNKAASYLTNFEIQQANPTQITQPTQPKNDYQKMLEQALKIADQNRQYGNQNGKLREKKELEGICQETKTNCSKKIEIPYSKLEQYVEKDKK
ncbi:hypothetical protein HY643_04260 [Candidatus Woesearchaeota archaeon]|nr:hypothetical protein [Candidatus Woesearchaeota archaeon]